MTKTWQICFLLSYFLVVESSLAQQVIKTKPAKTPITTQQPPDPADVNRMLAIFEKYRWLKSDTASITALKKNSENFNLTKTIPIVKDSGEFKKRTARSQCSDTNKEILEANLGPVRSQDSVGWCYAYAASDLLSHRLKQRVSALDISLSYIRMPDVKKGVLEKNPKAESAADFNGGQIKGALELMRGVGICSENDLRSDGYNYSFDYHEPGKVTRSVVEFGSREIIVELENLVNKKSNVHESMASFSECTTAERLLSLLPGFTQPEILAIMEHIQAKELWPWIQHLACAQKRIPLPNNLAVEDFAIAENSKTGHHFYPIIDEELNAGNIVAIAYSPHFFYNEKRIEKEKKELESQGKDPEKWRELHGYHASTIVGRRFNPLTDRCEYKVRNTWGRSCEGYDLAKVDCEEGNLWIGEDDLRTNLSQMTWIKR